MKETIEGVVLHVWCFDSHSNPVSLQCTSCQTRFLWKQKEGTGRPDNGLNFCSGCGQVVADVVPGPRASNVDYKNYAPDIYLEHLLATGVTLEDTEDPVVRAHLLAAGVRPEVEKVLEERLTA
jgi:hypothetical protein